VTTGTTALDAVPVAHGFGGAEDLPIPAELAIAGAVAALVVSFAVLGLAWRSPRYAAATSGRPAPSWLASVVDARWFAVLLRVAGMAVFLYGAAAAVFGKDLLTNPVFGMFYIWWWIGLVPLSLLFGPVWRAVSPVRTINTAFARLSGSDPDRGLFDYPARLGYWPGAVGLFAFVWLELVYPHSAELGPVRLWCAVYVAVMLLGGALFGSRFYAYADPFEVYSTLVGKMSVWGRRDGVLLVRSPLANLDTVHVAPGLTAVVAVLFGSTAFDSFQDSGYWLRYTQNTATSTNLLNNLALLAFCVGVGVILALGAAATAVGPGTRRRALPDLLAHAVVPIIAGYIVAHYARFLVEDGWDTLILASDPLGRGDDYLGTADLDRFDWLTYHPTFLANLKVAAVVLGHVLGVVAAHDRAVRLLPKRHQVTGQLAMLAAMIAFTVGGLYLLFAA
jgi:hypothetical protein